MPRELEDKIAEVKAKHKDWDEQSLHTLEGWSQQLSELRVSAGWLTHPATMELRKLANDRIQTITLQLANDENMPDLERRRFFAERDAHREYLNFLSRDTENEIKGLEETVDAEL